MAASRPSPPVLCVVIWLLLLCSACAHARVLSVADEGSLPGSVGGAANQRKLHALGDLQGIPVPIAGRIVVLYKREVTSVAAATDGLFSRVKVAFSDSSPSTIELVSNLTSSEEILDPSKFVKATATSQPGLKGIVVATAKPIPQLLTYIRQEPTVLGAFQDMQIFADQTSVDTSSVTADMLSKSILTGPVSSSFSWPGCYPSTSTGGSSRLVWVASRCGSNLMSIGYTAVYALSTSTNTVVRYNGAPCVLVANPSQPTWTRQRLGTCGTLPTFITDTLSMPTKVATLTKDTARNFCSPPLASGSSTYTSIITLSGSVKCGTSGLMLKKLQYYGVACGVDASGNTLLQWKQATASGCSIAPYSGSSLTPGQVKWNMDVFGACGVPPGKAASPVLYNVACISSIPLPNGAPAPSPSPNPSLPPQKLPRTPLIPGGSVPTGVARIEAYTALGVANTATIMAGGAPVIVAVADSGVECTHPDITCVSCKSWVEGSTKFPDDADGCRDFYGHGTHVAGIVSARNNGQGVVGVAPNVGVISLKILDGAGAGKMSSMLAAMSWVVTEGINLGVRVINFSLTTYFSPDNQYYPDIVKSMCDIFQQASDAGIIVTAAAGNSGTNMRGFFPATCPTVIAVTSINAAGNGPSVISNWLPADVMTAEEKASVIAAPGTGINSTVPTRVAASGYLALSGTSMAAPHIAGIAANCIMAGDCNAPGMTGIGASAVLQAAAQQRYGYGSYGFAGDAVSSSAGRYYGYLGWSRF